ncbi:uncharacterized protein LOC123913360 [Trifolium pratense]|uniref:uncharacterized protein LOC123913360 n=1 Tax=Trifolium pratense TaxID=57577 RepID=UPI001E6959BB|nr:uncharacterized protein LOC123913360 [Trifolium pratense]
MEVVIPAKRDKGGRRFGFARFDRVSDVRKFEYELDNIIIGREKLSVNLSRFQRPGDNNRIADRREVRKGSRGISRTMDNKSRRISRTMDNKSRSKSRISRNHTIPSREVKDGSYARAVRRGGSTRQGDDQQRVVFSYEAEKNDMFRLQKCFIGEVIHLGMSYNIQSAFHRQGYFGVKVTPLGARLTLLDGQEEGEVQALMDEAKDWLKQWFTEIRPWSPKEIDRDRYVWLRVYGIPTHAWNDIFFEQVSKPWGSFINVDDATMKKLTMDVARILI